MKKGYDTLSQAIEDLQSQGWTEDFNLIEDGVLSKKHKKEWKAGELDVPQFYRFEGMTNPGDNTILYCVQCKDGTRGLLVDAYGADVMVSPEMIQKLKTH